MQENNQPGDVGSVADEWESPDPSIEGEYGEAEWATLRSAVVHPHAFRSSTITRACFHASAHKAAWGAIQEVGAVCSPGEACDIGALLLSLPKKWNPKGAGGGVKETEPDWKIWARRLVAGAPPDPRYVLAHLVPKLYERWQMRAWADRHSELIKRVGAEGEPQHGVFEDWIRHAKDVSDSNIKSASMSAADDLVMGWNPDPDSGGVIIPTGIDQIDSRIGGGPGPGDTVMIGGGTGDGKSTCAIDMAHRRAAANQNTVYLSCEDGPDLISCRLISRFTSPLLPASRIREKRPEDVENVRSAQQACAAAYRGRVFIVSCRRASISRIVELIRAHRYIHDCTMFVLDYLQAVRHDDPEVTNKTQVVAEALDVFKAVGEECGMASVILSQYVRDDYKDGKEPDIYSFKYSGDAENVSEVIVLFWRDPPGTRPRLLHCKIGKLKWASVDGDNMRYIVAKDAVTGHHMGWQVDDAMPDQGSGGGGGGNGGARRSGGQRQDGRARQGGARPGSY